MTPPPPDLKAARHEAHRAFDALWMSGLMTRTRAYQWLAKTMQMTKRRAHIARFTVEQCHRVTVECKRFKNGKLP